MEHFEKLNKIDVSGKTEKKQNLTYLSWSWAWTEVKKVYPDATYQIHKFENNLPYVYDENTGYMVFTSVTIEGLTHEMWLPVMDGSNKAMKGKPYTYQVKEKKWNNSNRRYEETGNMIDKNIDAATMFDINKAIMRCLTKNLAMFGLGLYIYAGEDLPENDEVITEKPKTPVKKQNSGTTKTPEKKEFESTVKTWLTEKQLTAILKKTDINYLDKVLEKYDNKGEYGMKKEYKSKLTKHIDDLKSSYYNEKGEPK